MTDGARVFAVPPGVAYAPAFVAGWQARFGALDPLDRARSLILVNSRRSQAALEAALAAAGLGLLPRLVPIDAGLEDQDLAPAIDPLRRQLWLTRLVGAYLSRTDTAAPPAAAADLAEALARLLDQVQEEGVGLARLSTLAPDSLAGHWQRTVAFLDILREAWPAILAGEGALDPAARAHAAVAARVATWAADPPRHPVVVAGSTGSRPGTARLIAAAARLPQGAVVLPGFDPDLPAEIWDSVGPDHPMHPFKRLLTALDMVPRDVALWHGAASSPARARLWAEALRPAPVTDAWIAAADGLGAAAPEATAGISLIEATSPRHEAAAIALAMRQGLEVPGQRVALVTPDATLARRVTVELARFGIVPDDSLGRPLLQSPAGVFWHLVAEAAEPDADAVKLAALFAHPLACPGTTRAEHLRHARAYERAVLRRGPTRGLAPWPPDTAERVTPPEAVAWRAAVATALAGLTAAQGSGLSARLAAHLAAAEAMSTPPGEAPQVWAGADGTALAQALARVIQAAPALGDAPVADYPGLMRACLADQTLRPEPGRAHPRVAIRGPREGRIEGADLVILGGLNEGTWPAAPGTDPWLSRPMRRSLGLEAPEALIGLSAHDFLLGAMTPAVILTRSLRAEGTPQIAARWWVRLVTLLQGVAPDALAAMRARGQGFHDLVARLHLPQASVPRAPRPAPCPPVAARPRQLSVTEVERLIRDAYDIYAKRVLRLRPLDPLGRAPEARDRGQVIHAILHRFVTVTTPDWPDDATARTLLLDITDQVLAETVAWPDLRRLWRGRVRRFAAFLIEGERQRRAEGRPAALETAGAIILDAPAGPFTLTARADRIDDLGGGTAAIFDYKSAAPPSAKQIGLFAQQLHLQGVILDRGGFAEIPGLRAHSGAYIGLSGVGSSTTVADLGPEVALAAERLARLIADFDDPQTPYLAWGRAEKVGDVGDYDHLSRRAEWQGDAE